MMASIVVVGAGGHAKVAIEAIRADGRFDIVGVVDPKAPEGQAVLGVRWLGSDQVLKSLREQGLAHGHVAIGDNRSRERLGLQLLSMAFVLPVVVHPTAQVSPSAAIGQGSIVMARASVGPATHIGQFCIINTGAIVEHDSVVQDSSHVAPGATMGGSVHVGARALVGIGSVVRPGISIGNDAVIGAGSCVVRNLDPGVTVIGVPARAVPLRKNDEIEQKT
jgi:UDP-perosamine 4-acetyltransferase